MSARTARRRTGLVGVALCALLAVACSKTAPVVCEYAEVVSADAPGAIEIATYEASKPVAHVLEPARFRVKSAALGPSGRTSPTGEQLSAISIEMVPEDAAAFRAWTTSRVQRTMAFLLDRRAVTIATVAGPLPGSTLLIFPPDSTPDRAELWKLVDGMLAKE